MWLSHANRVLVWDLAAAWHARSALTVDVVKLHELLLELGLLNVIHSLL